MANTLKLGPILRLSGSLRVPGDKSISHRALMFAAVANGKSRIEGLAPGEDVRSTRRSMEALGVTIRDDGEAAVVEGGGWAGLDRSSPEAEVTLDCGNSGTTSRLLCGLLAGRRGRFHLTGDASLSGRPMGRVIRPLAEMGVTLISEGTLPLEIRGARPTAACLTTEIPSAQVKSALILAALQADGSSEIREQRLSRDHTERMLLAMDAPLSPLAEGQGWRVEGGSRALRAHDFRVPGDPSSAACAVALACTLAGSELAVTDLCVNETRIGVLRLLERMGASIQLETASIRPEPVGTVRARGGRLHGIDIGPADVVSAIDELPLLACVAATAEGESRISGAEELRHKESDRIQATVEVLRAFGAQVEERPDGMRVSGGAPLRGARVDARGDHRIAMCAAFLAAHSEGESELSGHEWIRISYPAFFQHIEELAR